MAIRLAYGCRDDIESAIWSGTIPRGTLIICEDSDELFFYDVHAKLKSLTYKNQFETLQEADAWVKKYDCGGEIIAVHDPVENACIPYVVEYNNQLRRLDTSGTTVISKVNPTADNTGYPIGASWLNTTTGYYYVLVSIKDGKATWNNLMNSTQLTSLGYMNKKEYDVDGDGIIDRSSRADKFTRSITLKVTGALTTGATTIDGSKDVDLELKPTEELSQRISNWDAKISSIKIDSKELPIEHSTRTVTIPVAGALCGVVKSSTADNTIKVLGDGTMRINKITVDNLKVAEGDELILHCGTSAIKNQS